MLLEKEIKMIFAVTIFFTLCGITVLFQLALALGAPWGDIRWVVGFLGSFLSSCG
jgi:hypothetical protein